MIYGRVGVQIEVCGDLDESNFIEKNVDGE